MPSPKKISLNVEPLPQKEEEVLEEPALCALNVSTQNFKSFFNEYLQSLDKDMRESFADSELSQKQMSNGYEQHYLAFKRGENQMLGLVLINMDHTYQTDFRAYIRHISTKVKDQFPLLLQLTVDFIWENLHSDTIRIDLHHYMDLESGNLKANNAIKDALSMQKKGFKWKSIMNDPDTGKRF